MHSVGPWLWPWLEDLIEEGLFEGHKLERKMPNFSQEFSIIFCLFAPTHARSSYMLLLSAQE
jgi:hypothetical protein